VGSPVIKFIEGLLAPALRHWAVTDMCKTQYGFRPGRGIEDARMNLMSKLMECRRNKQNAYVVFFDLNSAYDKVDLQVLEGQLIKKKIFSDT
jgi:retron-type reverse transcriptase